MQPMFLQQHAFTTSGHLERFKQCPSMEGVTHIAHGEGPESHTRSESMRNKKNNSSLAHTLGKLMGSGAPEM